MEEIVKYLLIPSNLITLLLMTGVLLLFVAHCRKIGLRCLGLAAILYIIFGSGPVSFWLLSTLEYQYPAVSDPASHAGVKVIVVLAGDAQYDSLVPVSSQVNSSSAFRLIEAARLLQVHTEASVMISGQEAVPGIIKEVLVSIGIPANKVTIDNLSSSTFKSAKNLSPVLGEKAFFLVTSAGHMPRAVQTFKKQGMQPIPAPSNYLTRRNILATQYSPSPSHLQCSDLAIHEYLALFW